MGADRYHVPPQALQWLRIIDGARAGEFGQALHAACGRAAAEAGLDPRFEVLDDVLAANLEATFNGRANPVDVTMALVAKRKWLVIDARGPQPPG